MRATSATRIAALNNAHWCDLICRLHGATGQFGASAWVNSGDVPPLYPNVVTTTPEDVHGHYSVIERLTAGAPGRSLSVKDSFRALDLTQLGFSPLFDAEWFWRPASHSLATPAEPSKWSRITSSHDLAAWEAAWRKSQSQTVLPPGPMFPPALLDQEGIQLVARRDGKIIAAGAIAHRWLDTVAITNLFSLATRASAEFGACLSLIVEENPGAAICGYEAPGFSQQFSNLGLQAAGPLRVWLKQT